jgi:hypothetical protein
LFASSGIEPEVVAAAELLEIEPGVIVPVATRAHLIALKVLASDPNRRPQDAVDLVALLARASGDDLRLARTALALVTERGLARDKDLDGEFDAPLRAAGRRERD